MKVYIVQYIPPRWKEKSSRVVGVYKDEKLAKCVCDALTTATDALDPEYFMDDYEVIE